MYFVAISKVKFPPELYDEIAEVGKTMVRVAQHHPGLISVALHSNKERTQTMMYWEWESQSHHHACMNSEDWQKIMANTGALFHNNDVSFSIDTYDKLV